MHKRLGVENKAYFPLDEVCNAFKTWSVQLLIQDRQNNGKSSFGHVLVNKKLKQNNSLTTVATKASRCT